MVYPLAGLDLLSFELFRWFPDFPSLILTISMAFLPTLGYVDTVRLMIDSHSDEPYNFAMVMIIKMAQLMKIIYFFYDPYAPVIFGQAITVFSSALLLTFLKFRYSKESHSDLFTLPTFFHILRIRFASTFCEHIVILVIYLGLILMLLRVSFSIFERTHTIELLGLVGNLLDTTISFPLFVRVMIHRQVKSVSAVLIVQYVLGDLMKVATFMVVETPWVFRFSAYCQSGVDGLMAFTFFWLLWRARKSPEQGVDCLDGGNGIE
jgi:hypothetical protein